MSTPQAAPKVKRSRPPRTHAVSIDYRGEKLLLTNGKIVDVHDFTDDLGDPVEQIDDATFVLYWIDDEWRCSTDLETLTEFSIN